VVAEHPVWQVEQMLRIYLGSWSNAALRLDIRPGKFVKSSLERAAARYSLLVVTLILPKHMKIVPLIGSAEVGPLGVLHLPRLWLKISLDAKGLLADGYPAVGTGFDQMVLDGLGLQKNAVVEYVTNSRPTYCQFESWITKQPGTRLDSDSIARLNQAIRGYNHDDGTVQAVLGENGLPADSGIRDAVTLNRIDDWKCFHDAVLK
jgi:hypothetical protein